MFEEATHEGASIHERLLQKISPETEVIDETKTVDEQVEVEEVAEDEGEQEPQEVETQETEDEPEGETLEITQLAEYLKFDPDKLDVNDQGEVVVKTKVDGVEGQATLADLVKSYQLEGHLNKQNMEVVETKKQLDNQLNEAQTKLQERLDEVDTFLGLAYQDLMNEFNGVNWNELEEDEPERYSSLRLKYQDRENKLIQAFQKSQSERQSLIQEKQKSLVENIPKVIPEWANKDTAAKEFKEISSYAQTLGFTQNDVNSILNPAGYAVLRKAMLFDRLQGESVKVTKQVRKTPKVVKTGAAGTKPKPEVTELKKLRSQIKSSGGQSGVIEYLKKTGKV